MSEHGHRPMNRVLGVYYHEFEYSNETTISYVGKPHLLALNGGKNGVVIGELANPENTIVVVITVGRISNGNWPPINHLIYYDANSNPPSYYCFHGTHEPLTAGDRAMIDQKLQRNTDWMNEGLEEG